MRVRVYKYVSIAYAFQMRVPVSTSADCVHCCEDESVKYIPHINVVSGD